MATTWTSNYAGKFAGEIMKPLLLGGNTLSQGLVTIREGNKYQESIALMTLGDDLIQAYGCDWNAAGTVGVAERKIIPVQLKVNLPICKSIFYPTWFEDQTGGSLLDSQIPNDWYRPFQEQLGTKIANSIENNLWQGNLATAQYTSTFTSFDGILTKYDALAGTVKKNISAITSSNVVAQMQIAADEMPEAMIGFYEYKFYVSRKTAQMYREGVSTDFNGFTYANAPELKFNGYDIVVCDGFPDNFILVANKDYMFFGTNLVSDQTNIRLIDMTPVDGSDNVRVIAGFSGGTQVLDEAAAVLCGVSIES